MKKNSATKKSVFYLTIVFMCFLILVPFGYFVSTSFYSGYEVYKFPKKFLPATSFDLQLSVEGRQKQVAIFEDELNDYEMLISTSRIRKIRRYLKDELSINMTDDELDAIYDQIYEGQPVVHNFKKDMFQNYKSFFSVTNNGKQAFFNSLAAAFHTIWISLLLGSMAGYAMARYKFKGDSKLSVSLLLVKMFPLVAISIPMIVYLIRMGLDNSMLGLGIVYSITNIALTAWITSSIFIGINVELEEASYVFGASKMQTFFKITFPLAFPGLMASSMYAFLGAWNDSITALILANANPTLSLLVYKALGPGSPIQLAAAGAVILIIPALVFTYIIKNYINQLWGDASI